MIHYRASTVARLQGVSPFALGVYFAAVNYQQQEGHGLILPMAIGDANEYGP